MFKKTLAVLIVFRNQRKHFDLLAKFFGRFVQTAFDLSVGSFWEVFLKKIRYILSFSHTEQTLFGIQSKIFQQGRQKELSKVLITSGHWAKSFRPFFKKVLQGYQNCILRVYRNILNKKNSWKKGLGFFYFFRTLSEKVLAFYQFFFDGVVKSVLYVSMGTLQQKMFLKKFFTISILFRTKFGNKIAFPASFFRQVWRNCILRLYR